MADVVTKLNDLINPQVMADIVSAKLESAVRVLPYAKLDTTLEGQAGDTITVPVFEYIGDAVDVAEGEDIPTRTLKATGKNHKIKKSAIGGILTDEAVLSGFGNPVGELSNQMALSIASKCDRDAMDALLGAKTAYTANAIISYNAVVDAIDAFEEEDNTEKVIFIHPKQVTQLRKDANFISADKYPASQVIVTGEIGMIGNAHVKATKKCMLVEYEKVESSGGGTLVTAENLSTYEGKVLGGIKVGEYAKAVENPFYVNPVVKITNAETDDESPAITIFVKRDTNIETDRVSKNRTTEVTGDKLYTVALTNDAKVVLLKALKTANV